MTPLHHFLSVFAKRSDPASGGKQTPGHYSDSRLNIVSGGSSLATQLVHAVGIAYALKLDGTDRVALTTYGEGAGSEGDAFEAFNFAAIHKLPVVFVCENNRIAISVPYKLAYAVEHAAQRAAGFGFAGVTVDGRDPVTCYYAAQEAISRARAGEGPTLLECVVDRLGSHTSQDDQRRYRTPAELEKLKDKDCVEIFRGRLIAEGVLSQAETDAMSAAVAAEVELATNEALAAEDARPEDALTNVYSLEVPTRIDAGAAAGTEEMTMVQALRDTLQCEMKRDERVMILGEDVALKGGVFLVSEGLLEEFGPGRVIDTPIAESSIVGIALGLALAGKRPVAEMQFCDFAPVAFNQITNEIAKFRYRSNGDWSAPIVIRGPMGGQVHGALYHSQSVEARFATPGLKIVIPSSPSEAKGLLTASLRDPDPVLFWEHKHLYRMFKEQVPKGEYLIPLGEARTVRAGTDVSVFCYGLMVHYALQAASAVEADGVSVEVVDLRTVYPLPAKQIVASARKTGKVLVLYEENRSVSIGSEVAAIDAEEAWQWLDAPVRRLGGLDVPAMPYEARMEEFFMPSPAAVEKALRELSAF
jgi:2-oxoisovalerate dehydrogenase E1 component